MSTKTVPVPPEIAETFPIWRLVACEKVVGLEEIERFWTIEDVMNACDMLDYMGAQQRSAESRARHRKEPEPELEPSVAAMLGGQRGRVRQSMRR